MLKTNVEKHIKNIITVVFSLLFISCEIPTSSNEYAELSFDMRLNKDDNGYYHLIMDRNNWQTLHRVSGSVQNTQYRMENFWVEWESNLYWYLGDTLGYIVNRNFDDNGMYVSIDTSYITGFNGMEVPTINCCSYSNSDGEVNTMIAPVQTMVGDTMTIRMYFWNNEYEIIQEFIHIVLD